MTTLTSVGLFLLVLALFLFLTITAIVEMIDDLIATYRQREWGEIIAWAWITMAVIEIVLVFVGLLLN